MDVVATTTERAGAHERTRHGELRWRVAWGAIFALFIGVRLYHLDRAPPHNATADEFAWTWSGMSLWRHGVPESWSNLKAYEGHTRLLHWKDHDYHLVKPWLDHPPLYPLYAGGWMRALGARDIVDADLWKMRLGSVLLAAISFGLFSALLRRIVSRGAALLALLFYAVVPSIVLHQRLVVSENLFTPVALATVLLLMRQRTQFAGWRSGMIALLCLLLPLTKIAALAVSAFLVVWAFTSDVPRERWIDAGAVVLGTCLGIGAYIVYGRWLDAELFTKVMTSHQNRWNGFLAMQELLFEPVLVMKPFKEMLVILGNLLALASLWRERLAISGLAVLIYAACMAFFVSKNRVFGWYFIPLYPWGCAALGAAIVEASQRRALGLSLLVCSAEWLAIVDCAHRSRLLDGELIRFAFLVVLLTLFGCLLAFPRFAHKALPTVNGLFASSAVLSCLFDVYMR